MRKISIIGSGNVGRKIGQGVSENNKVIFYDISEKVIDNLKKEGYEASLDINYAILNSDISFVAVPTPLGKGGLYETSYIESAAKVSGAPLKEKDDYHVFILKSTVVPGTTEEIFTPALEESSRKNEGEDFGVVYNPEFLTVIQNTWTDDSRFCITPDKEGRVVLGEGKNRKAGDIIEIFYREQNPSVPILRTDYKTSEMTKLAANSRLALAISYSNEIFLFCEELRKKGMDIDADFVMKAVALDPRIGEYGSVFGKAWGGPCFLKDSVALEKFLGNTGREPKIISASIEINNEMREKYGVRE